MCPAWEINTEYLRIEVAAQLPVVTIPPGEVAFKSTSPRETSGIAFAVGGHMSLYLWRVGTWLRNQRLLLQGGRAFRRGGHRAQRLASAPRLGVKAACGSR
jgi:hypothetical protein